MQSHPHLRVLLVDDNITNLRLLNRILQKHFSHLFLTIVPLTSGVSALEQLQEVEFDLILLDIDMPVLDGVQTTKHIRSGQCGKNREIPIIAVTTNDDAEQQLVYYRVGMNGCVGKPINVTLLGKAIEEALTASRGTRSWPGIPPASDGTLVTSSS
ncbi:uncharacterized protein VTP21DRAFT_4658 [Calcarisporiella thermophila]|uniref:uncharacterized protein n=1 Tax=Calcarisporiella thermophila TaxID=911321 RepID=UPI0037448AF6